jgi:hypothetical protein
MNFLSSSQFDKTEKLHPPSQFSERKQFDRL